ncbi:MAG: biosynthetic-type acetolactate synthase large subunit [Lachnospiraceae bacterium]|nr:biosynthetic-type acetolactate synthase large subunit [Lachnospiraceae bacterium]
MLGCEAMVKCLENEGVKHIFGYPGAVICPFFDSLLDSDIETVLVRTEQNAAHAASGYARINGGVGVCVATSGPGALNLLTGIATAFADSIPLVCITGQVESEQIGSDVFQEADVTGAAESFVKYSYYVTDAREIPRIMKEAFYIAGSGRRGPVLIDIPVDVQNTEIGDIEYPEKVQLRTYKPTISGHAVQIKKVAGVFSKAKRPLIYAGGGVHLAGAVSHLRDFAEKNGIPVVSTMMGLSVMPSDSPLFFGMVGNNGVPWANKAVAESDLIMMIGARAADRAVSQPEIMADGKTLIHIDADTAEIGKNAVPTIPLVGDAKKILKQMAGEDIKVPDTSEWLRTLEGYRESMGRKREKNKDYVDAAEFLELLTSCMKEKSIITVDVGQNQIWACNHAKVKEGTRFLTSGGMGTMGYSLPAAIGARKASSGRQIVSICGDGAFHMCMCELSTMMQTKAPVKVVVLNNTRLGMVREYQHYHYHDRLSAVELSGGPDIGKLAEAYGIRYLKLENMDGARGAVDEFLAGNDAAIMECILDPEALV